MKKLVPFLALIFALSASAATVYDSGPPDNSGTERSDLETPFKQMGGQFTVTTTQTLRSLEWWGTYGFGNTPQAVDAFSVQIFAVTAGTPALTPAFQYPLSGVPRQATGAKIQGTYSIYRYSSEIPATVLAPGTYVLSIMNDTSADIGDSWFFITSTFTSNPAWERNSATSAWFNSRDGFPPTPTPNIAFKISDVGIIPTLSVVTIASNNASPTRAKAGNVITLNFTASEPLQTPTVTLAGRAATVANPSGNNWTATVTVAAGDPQGAAAFSIVFKDLNNNSGTTASTTTNSSSVTIDTIAPVIAAHANVTAEATSASGAAVTYAPATATDSGPGTVTIAYSKASGTTFTLGTTTVTVTATDGTGNPATGTFTVLVRDTTPPVVTPPGNVSAAATSSAGAIVTYSAATATDLVGVTSLTYSKASGTTFAVGTTTVTATALDAAGNSTARTFTVTVLPSVASWRETYFGTTSNTGNAADSADPNKNGIVNLLEYAFHSDPMNPTITPGLLTVVGKSAGNTLQITFTRWLDRTDLTQIVMAADTPTGPWTNLATSVGGAAFTVTTAGATVLETGSGATRTVRVTDLFTVTNPSHPRRYLKLEISH